MLQKSITIHSAPIPIAALLKIETEAGSHENAGGPICSIGVGMTMHGKNAAQCRFLDGLCRRMVTADIMLFKNCAFICASGIRRAQD